MSGFCLSLEKPGILAVQRGTTKLLEMPGFLRLHQLAWAAFFSLGNLLYIPRSEEPGLERRFGDDYRRYKQHVPRWLPRWRPWGDKPGGM
jgi:protein-S-isoprenylcysteine O-methyltransferase Ste14